MKLLIEVQGNKPLNEYGDNHVIAYDSNKKSYYVTTAESFFASQNLKIKNMSEQVNEMQQKLTSMQQELANFEAMIQNQVNDFKQQVNDRFNDYLRTYQETNAKVLELVKDFI